METIQAFIEYYVVDDGIESMYPPDFPADYDIKRKLRALL